MDLYYQTQAAGQGGYGPATGVGVNPMQQPGAIGPPAPSSRAMAAAEQQQQQQQQPLPLQPGAQHSSHQQAHHGQQQQQQHSLHAQQQPLAHQAQHHQRGAQQYNGGPAAAATSSSSGNHHHRHHQRSSQMLQHRSSAAAISEPMMAATITDQLASASGPLAGSGGLLSQLGGGGGGQHAGYMGSSAGFYSGSARDYAQQQHQQQPERAHTSRYEAHYSAGGRHAHAGRHHSASAAAAYQQQQQQQAAAYGGLAPFEQLEPRGYYGGQPQHHHQSLGSLAPQQPRYDAYGQLVDQQQPYRPNSMGDGPMQLGLGQYNPLDDPLQPGASHAHPQTAYGQSGLIVGGHSAWPANVPASNRDAYLTELRARLQELQASYAAAKRELETATQKLGSSMHSIKSFWSPELKKERALRKEEQTKYALINDQMKLMRVEVQKQALLIRQLEDELRLAHETRFRTTDPDIQQHIDALCLEKESLFKESCLLRDTIRELEMRIETQKQTLSVRDESIKKMVEMMNNKGIASKLMEDERVEMDRVKTRNIELEARLRHYETIIENKERELIKTKEDQDEKQEQQEQTTNQVPKSPVPKLRKSLLSAKTSGEQQQQASATRISMSKAERLRNRLKSSAASSGATNQRSEQEQQGQNSSASSGSLVSAASSSSSSSSSGFSSSQSAGDQQQAAKLLGQASRLIENEHYKLTSDSLRASLAGAQTNELHEAEAGLESQAQIEAIQEQYKLCQCDECRTSGQAIYARKSASSAQVARKAVSFRPSVEHIGSPNWRPLNDYFASAPALNSKQLADQLAERSDPSICDSLQATKDNSGAMVALPKLDNDDDDYLRPLDCSTPKADQRLVRAEVHSSGTASLQAPSYTCLCRADFMCAHNLPQLATAFGDQFARCAAPVASGDDVRQRRGSHADFALSSQCIECNNLSTYVNLSDCQRRASNAITSGHEQPGAIQQEHYSKQLQYGNLSVEARAQEQLQQQQQQHVANQQQRQEPEQRGAQIDRLDESFHYLNAARRLQETLDNCELCSEQLARRAPNALHSSSLLASLECSCSSGGGVRETSAQAWQAQRLQPARVASDSSNATTSYHTADSCDAKLSVLPLQPAVDVRASSAGHQLGSYAALPDRQQLDSSLSSLFVYRHASDNEAAAPQPPPISYCGIKSGHQLQAFDPDSLELSSSQLCAGSNCANGAIKVTQQSRQLSSCESLLTSASNNNAQQQQQQQQQQGGWLKPRPKSDYIPLSKVVSASATAASKPNASQLARRQTSAPGAKFVQVDADLSQSSLLAKRRHQQQQQQQQQQKRGTQVAAHKQSNSLPAIASNQEANKSKQAGQRANRRPRQAANNVKSIYQCVKNHLLDMTTLSSRSNSSSNSAPTTSAASLLGAAGRKSKSSVDLSSSSAGGQQARQIAQTQAKFTGVNSGKRASATANRIGQMEELRAELSRRDQEMLTVGAKMKALEEQQRDSQRHIRVLKDSLVAKEEHYNLLLADVEELRRNLDERNKLVERRSYQQNFGAAQIGARNHQFQQQQQQQLMGGGGQHVMAMQQDLQEMQSLLDMRDKRIGELQRKVLQLDSLLAERDAHLERARARLEHSAGAGPLGGHHQPDALVNHLEETLRDKDKQIMLLRDQRDRAEHELNEERDSHERTIKEYKMKLQAAKLEMDKLQSRLGKSALDSSKVDPYGSSSSTSGAQYQQEVIKRLELDKRSLQLECDRLRDRLDSVRPTSVSGALSRTFGGGGGEPRTTSATGDYSVVEFERLQEQLEAQKQELRRAQAELRMNEMERKRSQEEADKFSERCERLQSEMHKLKAKLENSTSEREQLLEELDRQQQLISRSQSERDSALADINQIKLDNDRLQQQFNKLQLDAERLQAQLERSQLECRKLEDRNSEQSDELRRIQSDKSSNQRELSKLEMSLKTAELQQQRWQQERDLARADADKLRERLERLELDTERQLAERELKEHQSSMYKERLEQLQQQLQKGAKEREQMSMEMADMRERLHKQQKLQDTSEHETRNEVRLWKDKYERLLAQFEKINDEIVSKQKENQMVIDKLQRSQNELAKLDAKLEQSEMDRERMVIEVEKCQQMCSKSKEDQKRWQEELQQLQEMYTKTNTKLLKLTEIEERLRIDYEKCQMDLEVLRERYEKLQLECRKLQQERDRLQVEQERFRYEQQPGAQSGAGAGQMAPGKQSAQHCAQANASSVAAENLTRELERNQAKLEQYQREINKLQLEKERLILDSKAAIQQSEQQHQQQVLKLKSNEEKLAIELDRVRLQLDKVQSKCEQTNVDQDKLFADKERLQQQLLLLQQEVEKFRNQQSESALEAKRLHEEEMQQVLKELETIRDKYTQQRKELLQLRELQQNHETDREILRRELEASEARLEKLNQSDSKQRQDSERCLIEIEKLKDKIERKQQELARTQKERDQFAQEIQLLHRQIQQLQVQFEHHQQQQQTKAGQQQQAAGQQQQASGQAQQQQQQQQLKAEEIGKLKQMLVKSENELQKTMAENQRLQMEVERLKLQLDDAAEYIGKVEEDNKQIMRQNEEIIEQLKQQQQKQQQQQTSGQAQQQKQQQQQQQSSEDIGRAREEMRKMQEVIKKSAQEIQRMVDERARAQEANKELQRALEHTKNEFASTIEQYEAELDRLQKERDESMEQAAKQQQQAQGQQQQQQAPSDEYKVKFEKAVEAIKCFQKSSDDMRKEILKLDERCSTLTDQNKSLQQTLKVAEDNLKRRGSLSSGSGGGVGEQGQHQAANKETQEARQQVAKLSEMCAKLEQELNKAREEARQHAQTSQQLKQAIERTQADFAGVKSERDSFQQQLEKLIVELERREDEVANLQAQQDKSGQNVQVKQQELQAYQKQLEEREKALEAKRQELANMSKQVQQQAGAAAAGGANNQQQQEQVTKLQQQVKSLEEERTKLGAELERVRNELKQAQADAERLLKILSASEEEKFNLSQQIDRLQAKLKAAPAGSAGQQAPATQGQQPPPPPQQQQQQQQQQQRPAQQQKPPGQQPQLPQRQGQAQQQRPPNQQQQQAQQQPQQQQQRPAQPQQQHGAQQQQQSQLNGLMIQDNLDMLEAALKHSLEWSMSNRRPQEPSVVSNGIQAQVEHDSYVRAFVTRFKIKLNHLMGAKWMEESSLDDCGAMAILDDTATSITTATATDDEEEETVAQSCEQSTSREPAIKMRGKYSGVYQIGCDEENDEEEDVKSELSDVMAKCLIVRGHNEQIDDGYRSLSRGSGSLQRQAPGGCQTMVARAKATSLLQQLNDIKSRIVDLVDEIDQCTESACLPEDDIEAYRRRRDALLHKLDSLIESQKVGRPTTGVDRSSPVPFQSKGATTEPQSMVSDDGYEEQIQVIDYDFSRRASDLLEMKQSKKLVGPLVIVDATATTSVNVSGQTKHSMEAIQEAKIDFGAMIREYEMRKSSGDRPTTIVQQTATVNSHQPSSSSTSSSTCSNQSRASSSSFI